MDMTPLQAIELLNQVSSNHHGTRQDHQAIETAVGTLFRLVMEHNTPPAPVPAPALLPEPPAPPAEVVVNKPPPAPRKPRIPKAVPATTTPVASESTVSPVGIVSTVGSTWGAVRPEGFIH